MAKPTKDTKLTSAVVSALTNAKDWVVDHKALTLALALAALVLLRVAC